MLHYYSINTPFAITGCALNLVLTCTEMLIFRALFDYVRAPVGGVDCVSVTAAVVVNKLRYVVVSTL